MVETLYDLIFNYLARNYQDIENTDDVERHVNVLTNYQLIDLISNALLAKEMRQPHNV